MDRPMREVLYIAAKAPRVGFAKTRLGEAVGQAQAVALYAAFLRDLAARFADAPFPVGWYVTPPDAWSEIAPLVHVDGQVDGRAPRVLTQGPGDWTARQRRLFRDAAARGEERVVLVASDSPHLGVEVVADAFALFDRHQVVFGPVHDGGYYLIGMRGWRDVLAGIPMSTPTVLQDVVARARASGLSVGLVEPTFDVDEVDDLRHLLPLAAARADLAATRAALRALGLLR
ncbi:MAG: TIGR04282 family arsenosugar biosynthesis glycosyltransferase [Chloroflexi bacterium]|nr:TIGR04282 family arsenosugar biosynthesis glycosyltransferase [Chloroflexota bacterium]